MVKLRSYENRDLWEMKLKILQMQPRRLFWTLSCVKVKSQSQPRNLLIGLLWATTTTTIRLTQPYHGSGRRVIAEIWFGSVKCASELMKHGLYCRVSCIKIDKMVVWLLSITWGIINSPLCHEKLEIGIYEIVPKILTPTPTDSWDIVSRMRQILSCTGQFFITWHVCTLFLNEFLYNLFPVLLLKNSQQLEFI